MARVTRLELYRYNRLMLTGLEHFVMDIQEHIQVLIGRNGSGKSSILERLIPSTPAAEDFYTGGYCTLTLTHQGDTFTLCSTFNGKPHHQFLINGENQNEGGTGRVQDKLIEQYFGIGKGVEDLLLGRVLFTDLSVADRKTWMMRLSPSNVDYLMGVFLWAKGQVNQQKGVIQHLKQKLVKYTESRLGDAHQKTLNQQFQHLTKISQQVLMHITQTDHPTERQQAIYETLQLSLAQLLQVCKQADQTIHQYQSVWEHYPSDGALSRAEHDSGEALLRLQTQMSEQVNYRQRLEGLLSELSQWEKLEQVDAEWHQVTEQRTASQEACRWLLDRLLSFHPTFVVQPLPTDLLTFDREIIHSLTSLCRELPHVDDFHPPRQTLARLYEEQRQWQDKDRQAEMTQQLATAYITRYETAEKAECPSCHHLFRLGVMDDRYRQSQEQLKTATQQRDTIASTLKALEVQIEDMEAWVAQLNRLQQMMRSYPQYKGLWQFIQQEGLYYTRPSAQAEFFEVYGQYLKHYEAHQRLEQHYTDIHQLRDKLKQLGQEPQRIKDEYQTLEKQYQELLCQKEALQKQHQQLQHARQGLLYVYQQIDRVQALLAKVHQEIIDWTRAGLDRDLHQMHTQVLAELATITTTLRHQHGIETLIEETQSQLTQAEDDLQGYQTLASSLSPTEGLIADQLSQSVEKICHKMNDLLSRCWSYDMIVEPCQVEEGHLDYKFPLNVMKGTQRRKDIVQGSKGQKEIINLAFRIVAQYTLGLNTLPLYMDEPGQNFDDVHLNQFMGYINQLIESHLFPQLFLISHDIAGYGALSHSKQVVIDRSNITLIEQGDVA